MGIETATQQEKAIIGLELLANYGLFGRSPIDNKYTKPEFLEPIVQLVDLLEELKYNTAEKKDKLGINRDIEKIIKDAPWAIYFMPDYGNSENVFVKTSSTDIPVRAKIFSHKETQLCELIEDKFNQHNVIGVLEEHLEEGYSLRFFLTEKDNQNLIARIASKTGITRAIFKLTRPGKLIHTLEDIKELYTNTRDIPYGISIKEISTERSVYELEIIFKQSNYF